MTANKHVCVHGHFYQPPRENPWLEEVELQDSAYPYHDWNERITAECYAPNTASRILDADYNIINIINNYARVSFNFGPTLLSWLERKKPDIHEAIIEADILSRELNAGHGSALAQAYNHMIMPLANRRDKETQVHWGIRDFEHRFGREPEGMWLPETAADLETLDILAESGIAFTILAPRQAHRIRPLSGGEWREVGDAIDPKRPYRCTLPSGRSIVLFFYDGPVSRGIAFEGLLKNGQAFADRLLGTFSADDTVEIMHIATDGETYGHHHRHGDMALAYCLHKIESAGMADLTVYGAFLADNPPEYEVEIYENSSWSCVHGVERWRSDCGCNTGMHGDWNQAWRAPLREALDELRDELAGIYESNMQSMVDDPWDLRDDYIDVLLVRSEDSTEEFFRNHGIEGRTREEKTTLLELLEIQRHAMLMYTSCGWFFDEISGLETVQILQYAARAIQLAAPHGADDSEERFLEAIAKAPSNIPEHKNGRVVYEKFVSPSVIGFLRVGAHYAISSLFEEYEGTTDLYSYTVDRTEFDVSEIGVNKLAMGRIMVLSKIIWKETGLDFVVLHFGDHNIISGIIPSEDNHEFSLIRGKLEAAFEKSDIPAVITLIDDFSRPEHYSLWHLFRDEQRMIMNRILDEQRGEIIGYYKQVFDRRYPVMRAMSEMNIPLPQIFSGPVKIVTDTTMRELLAEDDFDLDRLRELVEQVGTFSLDADTALLRLEASERINSLVGKLGGTPEDRPLIDRICTTIDLMNSIDVDLNAWESQNIYFDLGKRIFGESEYDSGEVDDDIREWLEAFQGLGRRLGIEGFFNE